MAAHKKIKTNIQKVYGKPDIKADTVHIFTDGSCYPNPGPGGYAAVLLFNGLVKEIHGYKKRTTNNEMELMGILEGIRALKTKTKYPIIIYSDSQYSINCIVAWGKAWQRRNWITSQGAPVKNAEVIKAILEEKTDNMSFKWVKGHVGLEHNERADVLAGEARKNGSKV